MKSRNVLALSISLILSAPVLAQQGQPVFMPASNLKWTDLDPKGAPGVKIADLWGDHAKGAFGAFLKLPAGFAVPLHTHTHAMKVVFLSGTYVQAPEGKAEVRLSPGSYMMQPGGTTDTRPPATRPRSACSSWKATERLTSSRWQWKRTCEEVSRTGYLTATTLLRYAIFTRSLRRCVFAVKQRVHILRAAVKLVEWLQTVQPLLRLIHLPAEHLHLRCGRR